MSKVPMHENKVKHGQNIEQNNFSGGLAHLLKDLQQGLPIGQGSKNGAFTALSSMSSCSSAIAAAVLQHAVFIRGCPPLLHSVVFACAAVRCRCAAAGLKYESWNVVLT
jgi:hypothetical protein